MSVEIIVLAAGGASRFGEAKQLAGWFGKPLLGDVLDTLAQLSCPISICLGAYYQEITTNIDLSDVRVISVPDWALGPGASIRASIDAVEPNAAEADLSCDGVLDGVMFVLADQPLINFEHFRNILNVSQETGYRQVVATEYAYSGGKGIGAPAFFPRDAFSLLREIPFGAGAKAVIKELGHISVEIDGDLIDIDTKEDLDAAKVLAKRLKR